MGLKKLKSLILLTYYEDDNPVQTCEENLLLKALKGINVTDGRDLNLTWRWYGSNPNYWLIGSLEQDH